jgi:hypothetical protein
MSILLYVIYRVNATPMKIPMIFFLELEKNNLKIYIEAQSPLNSKSNVEQKE